MWGPLATLTALASERAAQLEVLATGPLGRLGQAQLVGGVALKGIAHVLLVALGGAPVVLIGPKPTRVEPGGGPPRGEIPPALALGLGCEIALLLAHRWAG